MKGGLHVGTSFMPLLSNKNSMPYSSIEKEDIDSSLKIKRALEEKRGLESYKEIK